MNIIYEGKEIASQIDVMDALIFDPAGGIADRIELHISDASDIWSTWKPKKGHKLELKEKGFSSDEMYIDQVRQSLGTVILEAISIPFESKSKATKTWEMVRFNQVAKDLAEKVGLKYVPIDITDWLYERVDQRDVEPLQFLNKLCIREGYRLKVSGGTAYAYDERKYEHMPVAETIERHDLLEFEYLDKSDELYCGCEISHFSGGDPLKVTFMSDPPIKGKILRKREYVSSQGEAERFSKGYLRDKNKYEKTAVIGTRLLSGVAGGSTIQLNGTGLSAGKYFVEMATHNVVKGKSELIIRGLIGGY